MMVLFSIAALVAASLFLTTRFEARGALVFAPVAGLVPHRQVIDAPLALAGVDRQAGAMTGFEDVALAFAVALKDRRFADAHGMLCAALRAEMSAQQLQERLEGMVGGVVDHVEVGETMRDWPDKQTDDVGWAYVAMSGAQFVEAVTVVVRREEARLCIWDVAWGRP
jgi:hypothetical protein